MLALDILQIVLMSTDASPLEKALLKSGLCKIAGSHIDEDINEVPWTLTLGGCKPENAEALEQVIRATLEALVEDGVPLELVENAIHQSEFHRSEIRADGVPFGLSLFMRSALLKQHKAQAEVGLKIHSLFDAIHKSVLEDTNYFGKLIKKYLLDNPHLVRVTMVPDKELAAKELAEERQQLERTRSQLSPADEQQLVKQAKVLAAFQKKQEDEDIEILPKVSLQDVPKRARTLECTREKVGHLEVFHHAVFTNQIVYADLVWDLPDLTMEELSLLRLFVDLLTQMGAGGRTYSENLEYIQAHTGAVGALMTLNLQAQDCRIIKPTLNLRGRALHRKVNKLFPLLQDFATSVDFTDKGRLTEILRKHYAGLESSLVSNAQRYAINLSGSGLNVTGKITNMWYGLDYYWFMKDLVQKLPGNLDRLIERLQHLQKKVLCLENPHLVLTSEASIYEELKHHRFYGLDALEVKPAVPWKGNYPLQEVSPQGRIIASPIAFTGKVFQTVPYVHEDSPALSVAACLFDNVVLHTLIREQGGAYSGGAANNSLAGTFYFHAYRDPNISRTLEGFEEAVKRIAQGDFTSRDLEEAKLEVIQGMDDPIKPGARGDYAYLWFREGRTFEVRQTYRDRLLELTHKDVVRAVKNQIVPNMSKGPAIVFAGKEMLQKENELLAAQGKTPLKIETV